MGRRAVVIGGAGQIGRATAARLADAGWSVTCVQRSAGAPPPELAASGVGTVQLDREADDALKALIGAGADAVIDTVAYTENHARQWLELQTDIRALVVISSASVYQDEEGRTLDEAAERGFPRLPARIPEDQPTVEPGPATYSTRKAALEHALLEGARTDLAILRPCAIYGPGCRSPREWWFLKRMLDARPRIPLARHGRTRFHTAYAGNIAELIRVVLDQGGTHVLNAADPDPPRVRDIGELIAAAHDWRGEFVGLDGATVGATPWSVERDFLVDMSRAEALGYHPLARYGDVIGETCKALAAAAEGRDWKVAFPGLAAYPFDLFDYEREDRALAAR